MQTKLKSYFNQNTNAAPLAVFRIGFGLMMLVSIIRFWSKGWIETFYLQPKFHFSYFGFEWIKPMGNYTYLLFFICGLAALLVALGLKYRLAIIAFFLSFTYIELMDKTTYLNHYYFTSILSFLMIFLPANAYFSLDSIVRKKDYSQIPKWTIDSIKLLLSIVYIYAGLAKLNSDWLFKAMPLKIWLPSKYDIPFIGETLMHKDWFHFAMSWSGMLYDLAIPFLLLFKRTRTFAFVLVVIFHVFTRVLFPIGMFPYIMIISTLIFFESGFHNKIIKVLRKIMNLLSLRIQSGSITQIKVMDTFVEKRQRVILSILVVFFSIQILLPWRYALYPNELFWTEEGYRFSWRVMLMEKAGYTNFKIVNSETNSFFYVENSDFLTPFQEKQMSFQPDFILEYAHFLGDHFKSQGHENIQVFVDCHVALNGRMSQRYINPKVDLYQLKESFQPKDWILPFNDEIKGL
ncbi:HTTM domain-containing protein [Winogradskyella haliclonae]|uniref:Type I deoxyribonuclease HsdR n=1 Tax=Winogradskyella haliclonae TaxID=2048558 RepID=A0ABQ2BXK4_9FLAO|nr:HTTM domain-containing protein [Winogradskyella haliclonae]GGI57244.1 type I deoxyribonuclease HsdR [Winogradskyella haliclonae]